ncbi:mirror-image polydactyly gene 1 protein isoform X7 [Phycodurus eques]|uniref:mirror-image polydactyly gene 1 protein isoform X7 n=1 Tax=Phycodurus eques TaxID=693459 RepID=UPI002ACD9B75|nr:mirror-image polydactyly gene 1 protein isoform X7 [Phycodurus eques]
MAITVCSRVVAVNVLTCASSNFCSSFVGLKTKSVKNCVVRRLFTRSPESSGESTWTPSQELRDSLVDMYTDNPQVNAELRRRLPSPGQRPLSPVHNSGAETFDGLVVLQVPSSSTVPLLAQGRTSCPASSRTPAGVADMETDSGRSPPGPETWEGPGDPTPGGLDVSRWDSTDKLPLGDGDLEVEELVQRVCDSASAQEVARFGSALVERVRSVMRRRRDIAAEEMKAVMDERDASLAECRRLRQEVPRESERTASEEAPIRLRRERDAASPDGKRPEAELQMPRADRSTRRIVKAPPRVDGQPRTPPLLAQLQQLSEDKLRMEAELLRCREAERDARERARRLERLVDVLRKKVGAGSPRAVV